MSDEIVVQRHGRVMEIVFNRADKKNALTVAMYEAIVAAMDEAREDPQLRVVLFSGNTECFTSGNDVGDFMNNPPVDENSPVIRFLQALATFPKVLMAAVNGPAVGVGTTMLMHCDLVYAGENARFQMPFVNLALVPEAGSSLLLPQLAGHRRASELLLLGEPFDGALACEIGLINEVCTQVGSRERALERAAQIASRAPEAVRLTKALLVTGREQPLLERMALEGRYFGERLQSPEAREAFTAFMERREPDFSRFE